MRLRNIPGAREFVAAHELVLNEKEAPAYFGKWGVFFAAAQPLYLEIGMGRGRFLLASAKEAPDINFLGMEIREEMIMQALEKMEAPLPNLRFLHLNAALLPELFAPGEVHRIYLHFPDPWPKSRHAKRRLTALAFMERYLEILPSGGQLHFKTDNLGLFEWSLPNFTAAGFSLRQVSRDLPPEKTGVLTEYESRYRGKGQPIYFLCAEKP